MFPFCMLLKTLVHVDALGDWKHSHLNKPKLTNSTRKRTRSRRNTMMAATKESKKKTKTLWCTTATRTTTQRWTTKAPMLTRWKKRTTIISSSKIGRMMRQEKRRWLSAEKWKQKITACKSWSCFCCSSFCSTSRVFTAHTCTNLHHNIFALYIYMYVSRILSSSIQRAAHTRISATFIIRRQLFVTVLRGDFTRLWSSCLTTEFIVSLKSSLIDWSSHNRAHLFGGELNGTVVPSLFSPYTCVRLLCHCCCFVI